MRTIMMSRRMLGWLGVLATVAVAGCTASSTPGPAARGHGRSASPAATTAVSPTVVSGSGLGSVRDLAVNRDVRQELTAAYADDRGISPADVAGTIPGSVYYAYDPATHTYWAQVNFLPSSTASVKVLVGFQDGASIGFFTRIGTGSWQAQLDGVPVVCTEVRFFPRAVLIAWSLPADTAGLGCGGSRPPRTAPTQPLAADPVLRAGPG